MFVVNLLLVIIILLLVLVVFVVVKAFVFILFLVVFLFFALFVCLYSSNPSLMFFPVSLGVVLREIFGKLLDCCFSVLKW